MNSVRSKIHEVVQSNLFREFGSTQISNLAWYASHRRLVEPTSDKVAARFAVDAALDNLEITPQNT